MVVVVVMVLLVLLFHVVPVLLRGNRMLIGMLVPIRMMRIDPIGMMVVPPVAIVPFVSLVEVAFIAPFGMVLGPFRMVFIEPAAVVIVPPVGLVPFIVGTVGAPSIAAFHLSPDIGMVLHELPQPRMIFPPLFVVNQVGIPREFPLHLGMFVEPTVEARLVVILGRRNRGQHRHRE